jgi:uncharacterized protein (DUF608 family)
MKKTVTLIIIMFRCLLSLGQYDDKLKEIDSIINDNASKILLVSTLMVKTYIETSHGDLDWHVCQVIKYIENKIPVEVQKVWLDKGDTGQVNTYYFANSELIKINQKVLKRGRKTYYQNFYLDKGKVISSLDSEGETLDPKTHLINAKLLLKRIKRRSEKFVLGGLSTGHR